MRAVFVLVAVALVVFAEDVFFFENSGNEYIHRIGDACYVLTLTQDEIDNIHNHTIVLQLQDLIRENQKVPAKVNRLNADDASAFVTHHCHNKELYTVAQ